MSSVAFLIHTRHDHDALVWCLQNLYDAYSVSKVRVVVISDGDSDPRLPVQAAICGAQFVLGDRLKLLKYGGEWTQRMLEIFLSGPGDWLIKIDPDSGVHRAFETFPQADLWGDVHERQSWGQARKHIQGGCIGIKREAAMRIVGSGLLYSAIYRSPIYQAGEPGTVSEDDILYDAAIRLGLVVSPHPEVRCRWREYVDNSTGIFAVTHPCKEMKL